jgi:hypothetical protein
MPQVNPHKFKSREWYKWTHREAEAMHDVFVDWLTPKLAHIQSLMEVGCGLHDFYENLCVANSIKYIGVDHDLEVIRQRHVETTQRKFICADFCNWPLPGLQRPGIRSDLVFSRAVIDHVSSPDSFISQALLLANKYVYIMTYRPCLLEAEAHAITGPDADGYFFNNLSMPQLERLLKDYKHELRRVPTGRAKDEIQEELHIVIEVPQ